MDKTPIKRGTTPRRRDLSIVSAAQIALKRTLVSEFSPAMRFLGYRQADRSTTNGGHLPDTVAIAKRGESPRWRSQKGRGRLTGLSSIVSIVS